MKSHPHTDSTSQRHARADTGLRYHSLVHPPLLRSSADHDTARMSGVWTDDGGDDLSGSLTTQRRLTVQGLQMKLADLGGRACKAANPTLRLLVDDQLHHIYLGTADYRLLAAQATGACGEPHRLPALVDFDRAWLMIDADRFFTHRGDALHPLAFDAMAAIAQARDLAPQLQRQMALRAFADEVQPSLQALLQALRDVLCQALGKPMTPQALQANRELIKRLGWPCISRSTLAGSPADIEALCEGFLGLRSV